jgi:hypothetical protein
LNRTSVHSNVVAAPEIVLDDAAPAQPASEPPQVVLQ